MEAITPIAECCDEEKSLNVKNNLQDISGKLTMAIKYKEEGTEHFKKANYKKAIVSYAKVTAFTRYVVLLNTLSSPHPFLRLKILIPSVDYLVAKEA